MGLDATKSGAGGRLGDASYYSPSPRQARAHVNAWARHGPVPHVAMIVRLSNSVRPTWVRVTRYFQILGGAARAQPSTPR